MSSGQALRRIEESEVDQTPEALAPVRASERIMEIDILRAFALLGIVLVNFSSSSLGGPEFANQTGADRAVNFITETFFNGKFYPLFSLLFGFGMAIQMVRAEARGIRFSAFYLKRLAILYAIGVVHFLFVWEGDILHVYAFYGLFLLLFSKLSDRKLLLVAALCITIAALQKPLFSALNLSETVTPSGAQQQGSFYAESSYTDMVIARTARLGRDTIDLKAYLGGLDIFGMFLLGLYAGRKRLLQDVAKNIDFIKRIMIVALAVGLLGLGWFFVLRRLALFAGSEDSLLSKGVSFLSTPMVSTIAKLYYKPALALFYGSALLLILQSRFGLKMLKPLAGAGRMALTNYLTQNVIAAALFYGCCLALYGKVGFLTVSLIASTVYLIQIPFSLWWLKLFRFGPMEWIWRSLTYGKLQPMRVQ